MKLFTKTLAVALVLGSTAFAAPTERLAAIQEQMLAPVVQINRNCSGTVVHSAPPATAQTFVFVYNSNGTYGVSQEEEPVVPGFTGGEIETYILTAKHCIDKKGLIYDVVVPIYHKNRIISEQHYKAVYDSSTADHDLALIRLLDTNTQFTNIAAVADEDVVLYEGQDVWTVGFSLGQVRTITPGMFGSREYINFPNPNTATEYFRATPGIAGGNSGGALFHEGENGFELLGVTSAKNTAHDFMGYYVPIDVVQEFLNKEIENFGQ